MENEQLSLNSKELYGFSQPLSSLNPLIIPVSSCLAEQIQRSILRLPGTKMQTKQMKNMKHLADICLSTRVDALHVIKAGLTASCPWSLRNAQVVLFSQFSAHLWWQHFHLNKAQSPSLKPSNQVRNLGVILDSDLNFNSHIK